MDYQFVKCYHPRHTFNRWTGEVVLTECGKCEACQLKKNIARKSRCMLENAAHRFCYFVTLTYENKYLPLCTLVEKKKTNLVVLPSPSLRTELIIPSTIRKPNLINTKLDIMMESISEKFILGLKLTNMP